MNVSEIVLWLPHTLACMFILTHTLTHVHAHRKIKIKRNRAGGVVQWLEAFAMQA